MADRRDYVALEWVKGEIEETLKQARYALEAFVETPDDTNRLEFSLSYIHQVFGTLQMVEFFGAALLAEEMELLNQAFIDGTAPANSDNLAVLMQAIIQLPTYLDQLKKGEKDLPIIILPLLNDLRAARGDSLLSETALFSPDLDAARRFSGELDYTLFDKPQTMQLVRKLRQMYQLALLGWLKGDDVQGSLDFLAKSIARMVKLTERTKVGSYWRISDAFVTAIKASLISRSPAIVKVTRDIDSAYKGLLQSPLDVVQQYPSESALKNLLFYLAKLGETGIDRIDVIQRQFKLENAIPSDEEVDTQRARLAGPDKDAIQNVVAALLEEISRLKDALDLMVRTQIKESSRLMELATPIQQLCDTMAVVGLDNPRRVLSDQLAIIKNAQKQPELQDDGVLMDIAGALLYVEATLSGIGSESSIDGTNASSRVDVDNAHQAVLREARNGIEQIKDTVVEYIGSHFDQTLLSGAPQILAGIRGGLLMVPLNDAARILQAVQEYIQNKLINERYRPEWEAMDHLADALVGVDYYLERLSRDGSSTSQDILRRAGDSLEKLGLTVILTGDRDNSDTYSTEVTNVEPLVNDDFATEDTPDVDVTEAENESFETDDETVGFNEVGNDTGESTVIDWDSDEGSLELNEQPWDELPIAEIDEGAFDETAMIDQAEFESDLSLQSLDIAEEASAEELKVEAPEEIEPLSETEHESVDDDLIDDDILEIFIEEANEVIDVINEFYPKYKADESDSNALSEFRRAYHTLKGSGRMVGATVVGETAWSIENMLNRLIDGTISRSDDLLRIIEEVTAEIPALVKCFEQKVSPDTRKADYLAAIADSISKGEPANWSAGETPLPENTVSDEAENVNTTDDAVSGLETDDVSTADEEIVSSIESDNLVSFDEEIVSSLDTDNVVSFDEDANNLLAADNVVSFDEDVNSSLDTDNVVSFDEEVVSSFDSDNVIVVDEEDNDTFEADSVILADESEYSSELEERENDANLLRIFKSELESHLEFVENYIADSPIGRKLPDALQRALHTMKGSAHMASMDNIAEAVMPVELLVKEVQESGQHATEDFVATLSEMVELVTKYSDSSLTEAGTDELEAFVARVIEQRRQQQSIAVDIAQEDVSLMSIFLSESMDIVMDAESMLEQWRDTGESGDVAQTLIRELDTLAHAAHAVDLIPLSQLSNELRSLYLATQSNTFMIEERFFSLAYDGHESLISMMDRLAAGQSIRTDALFSERLQQLYSLYGVPFEVIPPQEEKVELPPLVYPEELEPVAHVEPIQSDAAQRYMVDGDPELVEIFLEEANDILESIQQSLDAWISDTQNTLEVESLQRDLHTLKGGARMAEVVPLGDLAHELEFLYEGLAQGQYQASNGLIALLQQCHDRLAVMVGDIESSMTCMSAPDLVAAIAYFRKNPGSPALPVTLTPVPVSEVEDTYVAETEEPGEIEYQPSISISESDDVSEQPQYESAVDEAIRASLPDDLDFDILEIFIDEAGELLNELENAIEEWRSDASNEAHADEMKRVLHTLKGGARLARLKDLGDLSHDFETFVIKTQQNKGPLDEAFFSQILAREDQLAYNVDQLQKLLEEQGSEGGGFGPSVIQMVAELDDSEIEEMSKSQESKSDTPKLELVPKLEDYPYTESTAEVEQPNTVVPFQAKADAPQRRVEPNGGGQAQRAQPQETVKVNANLLEGLVNLAGETSISRARLEQEVSDFGFTLTDMDQTIDRLRDHVRRLDMETEAQIVFRQERAEETNYEDFDPLEMDRYSQIQQLSRSLMEATYDLQDIKSTLTDKTRDAETILLQQSRINTELQEGLMRTRMVPFNRLLPRLRRIVRQVAGELGKEVDFIVGNAEGEVDRTVLERMISPLEHLLRNGVDHGIEMPDMRVSLGKESKGIIQLDLSREGGDIVLRLRDDGNGIDVNTIRSKAIERGLMQEDSELNDGEIMQFILEAGFSTAEKVTQISGRGVGMDVVNSEVKQLGGNIHIESEKGRGTIFTIRLPFTVSVNRALMVKILDDLYALPLTSIEGIVRVTPKQLAEYYQPNAPLFDYGGRRYRLEYMGALLHTGDRPSTATIEQSVPLILVRGSDDRHSMALHVDQLMGSREIVVKTLGAQFSKVPGVSGATILGDGSVVVILDLSALIRSELVIETHAPVALVASNTKEPEPRRKEGPAKVMVCDDSVTVRKVTSRLLERNGMDVMLAKHGADAIAQMIDEIPDLILLDIEMPYMDGFEVASRVRHDERLKHIPIVMITSRTGSKHRERALSLGVNDYMGKPFQEGPLLSAIEHLLSES